MHRSPTRWRRRRFITQASAALLVATSLNLQACGEAEGDEGDAAGDGDGDGDAAGDGDATGGDTTGDGDGLTCDPTAPNIEGPFYRPDAPEQANLAPEMAPGDPLTVTGVVLDGNCDPIANALLDLWQADAEGHYDNDGSSPPPADDEFSYRGRIYADAEGRFEFESIVPGRYLNGDSYRPAHIHVKVSADGFELLTTQLYFEGDPYNDADGFIVDELIMPVEIDADGRWRCTFDFALEAAG